jgi:superfamily II DNA or RNA helicase
MLVSFGGIGLPKVIDNIQIQLLEELRQLLEVSHAADFCVGYFHLRGWRKICDLIEGFKGADDEQARVLVGMGHQPDRELMDFLRLLPVTEADRREMKQRETELVEAFKKQLTFGLPDAATIVGLQKLARQLREKKVCVKLFLRHPLHAKLYLTYNKHPGAPIVAFVGSSNLTGPGLSDQGELNVDVMDGDAACKLRDWFEARWSDQFARDVSDILAEIIEQSWAREQPVSPYLVYLKVAYHLAFDAIEAPREFSLPPEFDALLLDFQKEAVARTMRMLRSDPAHPDRNRVALIGDVVGMGKTLTATAVAKTYLYDGGRCIVCCPPKLEPMWNDHLRMYEIPGEVVPYSKSKNLEKLVGRCRLMILDESHNLRNRERQDWAHIHDFAREQDARVLLLSATPFNKHYTDLGNQLRLALDEKVRLGVKPSAFFRTHNEQQFVTRFQADPDTLTAFEQSPHSDDWRDLLKNFMVRRTRGYIIQNYGAFDQDKGRYYLTLSNGIRTYFPKRVPITLPFTVKEGDPGDQYARMFTQDVVNTINGLDLPRYGLGMVSGNQWVYIDQKAYEGAPAADRDQMDNLSKAGDRLIAYSRINLFKRLESCGLAFLLSIERHVLRNMVFVHAIDNQLDLPIGTQDSHLLDTATADADPDHSEDGEGDTGQTVSLANPQARARKVYETYAADRQAGKQRFRWISSTYFRKLLRDELMQDAESLLKVMENVGAWKAADDAKLKSLETLLIGKEKSQKALIFTQFADTAHYLARELQSRGMSDCEAVTAGSAKPVETVWRFSPRSNRHTLKAGESELRVLIATEVLSEGQNCQDASVVVNYDLPWAIIRLIQRAGRVDRIGQENEEIRVYSCLPAAGVERIISLRSRLKDRLSQNREVVGTDEQFFEDEVTADDQGLRDLYAGTLDLEDPIIDSDDVDIPSKAMAIWQDALKRDPSLEQQVRNLPDQVFACRPADGAPGAVVYFKTADGFDSLLRTDAEGNPTSQSLVAVLRDAACAPDTPALSAPPGHHEAVKNGIVAVVEREYSDEGALGPPKSTRRRVYERMVAHRANLAGHQSLFASADTTHLGGVLDDLIKYPLAESARKLLNKRLNEGITDPALSELLIGLREDQRLSYTTVDTSGREPRLICSIGFVGGNG